MSNTINYPTGEDRFVGKEFTINGSTKVWDGDKWVSKSHGNHELRLQTLENKEFETVEEAKNFSLIERLLGKRVYLKDRQAYFNVVEQNLSPNDMDIIESDVSKGVYLNLFVGNSITPKMLGAVYDLDISTWSGTDNSAVIDRADELAIEYGLNVVTFDARPLYAKSVTKSCITSWVGVRGSDLSSSNTLENRVMGSAIYTDDPNLGCTITSPNQGNNVFAGYVSQFDNVDLVGNFIKNPNCTGYKVTPLIKQLKFDSHWVRGFYRANNLTYNGEVFYDNCNYQFNKFSFYAENCADMWFSRNHFGSGWSVLGSDFSGGLGIDMFNVGGVYFLSSRPQVQDGGLGGRITLGTNINISSCFVDQSDRGGLDLLNCTEIKLIENGFFDNGKEGGGKYGLQLSCYSHNVTLDSSDNTMTHGTSFSGRFVKTRIDSTGSLPTELDNSIYYWTRYLSYNRTALYMSFQDARDDVNRVEFSTNGNGQVYFVLGCKDITVTSNSFNNKGANYQPTGIKVIGDDKSECAKVLISLNNPIDCNLIEIDNDLDCREIRRNNNINDLEAYNIFNMSSNLTIRPYEGVTDVVVNGSFLNDREVTIEKNGIWNGYKVKIVRATTPQGDANSLTLKDYDGNILTSLSNNQSATIYYVSDNILTTVSDDLNYSPPE